MLYTLPGIPSIYYGSEFGVEGKKEHHSDDSLRPVLNYDDYKDAVKTNPCTKLISALGKIRQITPALCYGDYKELLLSNTCFAYNRSFKGESVIVTVNNSDETAEMNLPCRNSAEYIGALTGEKIRTENGTIKISLKGNFGEIWIASETCKDGSISVELYEYTEKADEIKPIAKIEQKSEDETENSAVESLSIPKADEKNEKRDLNFNKPYEEMSIGELQEAILEKMRKNGPVTDYMLGTVRENTHKGSLLNWVRSFN
jgi:hypothetical protein